MTERVTLGTAALMPVLRRPVQAAQTLASIDLLSQERLTVSVGAGFPGRFGKPMYAASQVPWERRFARLDETVALWRQLWREPENKAFHGELLHFDDLPTMTSPFRKDGPSIWLAGITPTALARTGRMYDGWLPYPPDPADYKAALADVHRAAAERGRAPDAVTPALFASVKIQAVAAGGAAEVAARLAEYTAAGARHLVLRLGTTGLEEIDDQLGRVAELLPRLR
ncbi:LLM class flavin-dependent oxidoreductase [Actinomadura sp. LD22]|uniref:LLM class flavin-dependent oxidoreductase n=1 Tax=Actinomadura physcomitrii TaxID=2650748 RepID=A0A6I4MM53_9ACTN|nr:LLM class flavin-dependent oxidoreductase [Actinomadura physcomitrii]